MGTAAISNGDRSAEFDGLIEKSKQRNTGVDSFGVKLKELQDKCKTLHAELDCDKANIISKARFGDGTIDSGDSVLDT